MPRSRSIFIQSERVERRSRLALTCPARWMAPPDSSSFSVSVVLPASGCEMIANVRRRSTSAASGDSACEFSGRTGAFISAHLARKRWKIKQSQLEREPKPRITVTARCLATANLSIA